MASRRSWAKACNLFWSNHAAGCYRGTLEAETYCRKHDLSTRGLMGWARHLLSADDLRKREVHLRNLSQKSVEKGAEETAVEAPKGGLRAIATSCARRVVRLRFKPPGARMSER